MESAWLAIIVGMVLMTAISAALSRTEAAQRIAELIGFGDMPEWKK